MKILFTSPGRRIELIKAFRENIPKGSKLFGADFDKTCPASFFLDGLFEVPFKINNNYVDVLFEICQKNKIELLIPLIDPELLPLANYKAKFLESGTVVMISNKELIEISRDKYKTFEKMNQIGVPVPKTMIAEELPERNFPYPYILKPRDGSSSKGIYIVNEETDLPSKSIYEKNYLAQELIDGFEVTVDIFSDSLGNYYEGVQRKRLKVRGGEVERAITIKSNQLNYLVEKLVKNLRPYGVINVQFIYNNKTENYHLMEINPRFGGGFPLSYNSGANYPKMLMNLINNKKIDHKPFSYIEGKYMLRYDTAVYTKELKGFC